MKFLLYMTKMLYICSVKTTTLGYGVMVTLQILVLSFLVRIQVAQRSSRREMQNISRFFIFKACRPKNTPVNIVSVRYKETGDKKSADYFLFRLYFVLLHHQKRSNIC